MSQFVPIASCTVTGHHRRESGFVFFLLSCQVFIHTDQIPLSLLSSVLNTHCTPPPHTLCNRCSYPLIFFVAFSAFNQLLGGEIL